MLWLDFSYSDASNRYQVTQSPDDVTMTELQLRAAEQCRGSSIVQNKFVLSYWSAWQWGMWNLTSRPFLLTYMTTWAENRTSQKNGLTIKRQSHLIVGRGLSKYFQRRYAYCNENMERCSPSLVISVKEIKAVETILFHAHLKGLHDHHHHPHHPGNWQVLVRRWRHWNPLLVGILAGITTMKNSLNPQKTR